MIMKTLFPGRYEQGYEALKTLDEEVSGFGERALFLCDPFVKEHILPEYSASIGQKVRLDEVTFGGECSDREIERLQKPGEKTDMIIGFGGGKTLDTAKAVAHHLNKPVVIVPSLASTDAPCSALSVIYTEEGSFDRYLFLRSNPDIVLVDTQIVASAPDRLLSAGMGDALATWFEAESCRRTMRPNMSGRHASLAAYHLAGLCYDTLIDFGPLALQACRQHIVTPALDRVVEANTLLSGVGFESGGLAAAHAIHNGLTVLGKTHSSYHGEKVAIGVQASLFLNDYAPEQIDEVYCFCEAVDLPVCLADIGLKNVSDEDLMKAAEAACAEGETIHNEARPVNARMVFQALRAADAYGSLR